MAANFAKLPGLSGHPRNYYDALGITVAAAWEVQDQAGRPRGERAKVGHSLCDHRDVASNLDLHVRWIAVEAFPHILDCFRRVSHGVFPLRWPVAITPGWVTANNADPSRAAAKLPTRDEARRIAVNIAKLPALLLKN